MAITNKARRERERRAKVENFYSEERRRRLDEFARRITKLGYRKDKPA